MDGPRHNRLFARASVTRTLPKNMKSLRRPFAAFVAVCLMSTAAFAADASGTWKWTQQGRGGKSGGSGTPRETTLTLKQTDGKLTGTVSSPGRDGAKIGRASCRERV